MKLAMISGIVLTAVSLGAAAQGVTPTYDITGVWNSDGGGTFQVFQEGTRATAIFVGPDYAHLYEAKYKSATTLTGRQVRVTRASGCTTDMWQTYYVQSKDLINVSAVAQASNCDLVKGQIYTSVGTRVL